MYRTQMTYQAECIAILRHIVHYVREVAPADQRNTPFPLQHSPEHHPFQLLCSTVHSIHVHSASPVLSHRLAQVLPVLLQISGHLCLIIIHRLLPLRIIPPPIQLVHLRLHETSLVHVLQDVHRLVRPHIVALVVRLLPLLLQLLVLLRGMLPHVPLRRFLTAF